MSDRGAKRGMAGAGPPHELYRALLRAAVRRVALGDGESMARLEDSLSDHAATERLLSDAMYWSHRSPLLVADQLTAAVDADSLSIADPLLARCRALGAASRRRNALLMDECASVLDALGPSATPLKGAWLLRHGIYPSHARLFGDLDFAIDPAVRPRDVVRGFAGLGYEFRAGSTPDHLAFQRVVPGMRLYEGVPALREPIPDFSEHYARMQRTFFVEAHYDVDACRSLRRRFFFAPEDEADAARHLLLLAHHLCKHEFAHAIGVVDIALLAASPTVDWGRLDHLCRRFGATDICAAGLGIAAECFGADVLPEGAAGFRSRGAFRKGAALGWAPAVAARAPRGGRWLSVRLSRSLRSTYSSGMKALGPLIPKQFPLRVVHRRAVEARVKRRAGGLPHE